MSRKTGHPPAGTATTGIGAHQRTYRVLMIAPTSFFGDYGCHVRILEETRILEQLGHPVAICTYQNGQDVPGVRTLRTLGIPWRRGWEVGSSWHKIGYDILLALRALAAMWQVRPDVIHAHLHEGALIGLVLAWLWRIPLVFDFQGSLTSEMVDHHFLSPYSPFYGFANRLERLVDHLSPRIITSSKRAAELLTREYGCSPAKLRVVPDCVNTQVFAPLADLQAIRALRRAWGIPPSRRVVIYLGLLASYQGIDHLLRCARTVLTQRDDVHFVIAGYPNVDYYLGMAREMGLNDHVTFPGRVRYEDAPRVLAMGDIAVAPKLSKTEGAGKLLNYMAMGLPTVAFDSAVSREYLGDEGVYATPGDSDDLARCIESLLDDPTYCAELGHRLRARAERYFTWEVAGRRIVEEYASLARHNPAEHGKATQADDRQ